MQDWPAWGTSGRRLDARRRPPSGTQLLTIAGVGTVTAARTLAHTGDPARFPDESAFANYTGTAPVEIASPR